MRQAIKHSGVYQCTESYLFLKRYVNMSNKFQNKEEMLKSMLRIAPPGADPELQKREEAK